MLEKSVCLSRALITIINSDFPLPPSLSLSLSLKIAATIRCISIMSNESIHLRYKSHKRVCTVIELVSCSINANRERISTSSVILLIERSEKLTVKTHPRKVMSLWVDKLKYNLGINKLKLWRALTSYKSLRCTLKAEKLKFWAINFTFLLHTFAFVFFFPYIIEFVISILYNV